MLWQVNLLKTPKFEYVYNVLLTDLQVSFIAEFLNYNHVYIENIIKSDRLSVKSVE